MYVCSCPHCICMSPGSLLSVYFCHWGGAIHLNSHHGLMNTEMLADTPVFTVGEACIQRRPVCVCLCVCV